MSLETKLASVFGLRGEDAWRRHANPWSVYTRIPIPVLLVAAIWSRAWIGWWSLVPVGLVLIWTLVNPRVFPAPRSLDSWASRGRPRRGRVGPAKRIPGASTTPRRAAGARRGQRGWRALPGVGAHRSRPVDHRVRSRSPDDWQAVVHRPDGAAVRRRQSCRRRSFATNRSMKSSMRRWPMGRAWPAVTATETAGWPLCTVAAAAKVKK